MYKRMGINTSSKSRAIVSAIICLFVAVSTSLAQTYANGYDSQWQQITGQWDKANAPAKAPLLDRMYQLREFVTDTGLISKKLNSIAEDWDEPVLVRDEANWYRAKIALHEGRFDEARRLTDALGFVRDWSLTKSSTCLPLDSYGTTPVRPSPLGILSLHSAGTTCVATAIYSAKTQNVALRFGANVPLAIFVNSTSVDAAGAPANLAFDQRSLGVSLQQGWNVIALELAGGSEARQFALRISAPEGSGIPLPSDTSRINARTSGTAKVPVSDLLKFAERITSSASAFETTAALREIRGLGKDYERLETAAKISPTPDRWIAVASACQQQACTFNALTRALQLNPNYAPSKVALANYHLARGEYDKARNLLWQVLAMQPSDMLARKTLADVHSASGSTFQAIVELKKLEGNRAAPIWLKRELALRYEANGLTGPAASLLNQVWKSSLDDARVRAALQRLAEKRGDSDMLRMLAQSAELLDPMDPDAQLQLARFEPNSVADNAEPVSENTSAQVRSADLQTFANHAQTFRAQYVAQQLDPEKPLPAKPAAHEDEDFLVDAAALARQTRQNPVTESGNIVTLADVNVERLRANGQSTIHAQQVFFVGNQRGARDYTTRAIHYSHATQKLTVLAARVFKADGRVLNAVDQGESAVADTSVSMYYDTRARSLRFPSLEKGDTIELEYRISPNSSVNPYGTYFGTLVAFQNGLQQRLRRYVLIAPSQLKLNVVEQRMPVRAAVSEGDDQIIHRWDVTNIAPLLTEPRGPALTEVAPYVTVSTFADWNQLGKWYADLITPQFSLDGELLQQVQQITATAKSEQEKIHEIHAFVLRNTHYVAMEFGVYSYKPYTVAQTYARRFGDCKDKATLMIAMLRAAGVDAEFALVRTRKLGDVSERATNIAVFNHAVAYIPKYDLWLDGTAEYAGSRELPLDDQGAMALTVNLNGNATLRRIPVTLPMQNYTHRVVRAEVRKDGSILFNGSAYTRGEDAPGLRREYEIADRQRDTVRANLAQVYPSVQVDSVMVDGAHDIERDIHVKFSGSLNKFAGQKQLTLVSSWLPHQYVNSLASLHSRTQQLQLPAPWTTEEEIHFLLPEGGNIDNLPANVRMETQFGGALIRYERRGREMVVTTSVQFSQLRIEPAEYGRFRQFCSDVEKAFTKEIKVRISS
jgi:transglutaminase-like putative cysteine protease